MGLQQIKMFSNGVKAVLTPKGKGRQLMQVFDKENCMIAQREVQTRTSALTGSKTLEKLTLRQNKEGANMVEYLATTSHPTRSWSSRRIVRPEYSDSVFINNNITYAGGEKDAHYFQEFFWNNSDLKHLKFPLLKRTNQTKTKFEEVRETLSAMWGQWYNPSNKGQVKPMMPKSLEKLIANA